MRIAVIVSGVPHPTEGASAVLFHSYIAHLARSGHAVRSHVLADNARKRATEITQFTASLCAYQHEACVHGVGVGLTETARFRLQIKEDETRRVAEAILRDNPDVILAFDVEAALCVPEALRARSVVWLGDLRFATIWYHWMYSARESLSAALRFPYAAAQSWLWRRLYARSLAGMGRIIVASKSSEEDLAKLGLKAKFLPYPWPTERLSRTPLASPPATPRFLFFGHLQGLGSRSSLRFLIEDLYPRLVSHWGEAGFEIVIGGRHAPSPSMLTRIKALRGLSYVGFIDDLDTEMDRSHAVIAPIDVPVGNRSRILTAMANGALVIAHRNVALGNPYLVDGSTALLADDADGFVARMERAFSDPNLRRSIIDNARDVYHRNHFPEAANPLLERALMDLTGGEPVPGDSRLNMDGRAFP